MSPSAQSVLRFNGKLPGDFPVTHFEFYTLVIHNLPSLSVAERPEQLIYLPAWIAMFTARRPAHNWSVTIETAIGRRSVRCPQDAHCLWL